MAEPIRPEERFQKVLTHLPEEDLNLDPSRAGPLYVSNIVHRVFARLFGKNGVDLVELQVTKDGEQKVRNQFQVFTAYDVGSGAGSDTFVEKVFSDECGAVVVTVWDNPAIIQWHASDASYGGDVEVEADSRFTIPAKVKAIRVKNKNAGSAARWQAVGFYRE